MSIPFSEFVRQAFMDSWQTMEPHESDEHGQTVATSLDVEHADHDALAAEWSDALAAGYYGETGVRRY